MLLRRACSRTATHGREGACAPTSCLSPHGAESSRETTPHAQAPGGLDPAPIPALQLQQRSLVSKSDPVRIVHAQDQVIGASKRLQPVLALAQLRLRLRGGRASGGGATTSRALVRNGPAGRLVPGALQGQCIRGPPLKGTTPASPLRDVRCIARGPATGQRPGPARRPGPALCPAFRSPCRGR